MTTGLNITLRTHAVNSNLVPDRRKNAKTRARNMTIHSDLLYFSRDIELHLFIMIIKHSKKCRRVCLIFAILSVKVWVLLFNIGPMLKSLDQHWTRVPFCASPAASRICEVVDLGEISGSGRVIDKRLIMLDYFWFVLVNLWAKYNVRRKARDVTYNRG